MSDKENQDLSADSPILDTLGHAVKTLIEKGKVRGYITVEELNHALPSEKETSEKIEDIMASISDLGISLISETETDEYEAENEEVEEDEDIDESGNFDEKELSRSDDPVRMYLREMGAVELLSREGDLCVKNFRIQKSALSCLFLLQCVLKLLKHVGLMFHQNSVFLLQAIPIIMTFIHNQRLR